ncbi:cuticlin 2-like [Agelaius tricolor]|uniref:cuticlin 2-like n=1 Tax=Agelaius tricolor TaxID=9191 RepID=UPI0039F18F3E
MAGGHCHLQQPPLYVANPRVPPERGKGAGATANRAAGRAGAPRHRSPGAGPRSRGPRSRGPRSRGPRSAPCAALTGASRSVPVRGGGGGGGGRRGRSRWCRCVSRPLPRAPPAPDSARRPHHPRYFLFCYRVNVRPGGGGARADGRPRRPIEARGPARRWGGDVIGSQWGGRGAGPEPRGSRLCPRTGGAAPARGPAAAPPAGRRAPGSALRSAVAVAAAAAAAHGNGAAAPATEARRASAPLPECGGSGQCCPSAPAPPQEAQQ